MDVRLSMLVLQSMWTSMRRAVLRVSTLMAMLGRILLECLPTVGEVSHGGKPMLCPVRSVRVRAGRRALDYRTERGRFLR